MTTGLSPLHPGTLPDPGRPPAPPPDPPPPPPPPPPTLRFSRNQYHLRLQHHLLQTQLVPLPFNSRHHHQSSRTVNEGGHLPPQTHHQASFSGEFRLIGGCIVNEIYGPADLDFKAFIQVYDEFLELKQLNEFEIIDQITLSDSSPT